MTPADDDGPVTVAVTRVVRPGREREFARWAEKIDAAAAGFEGHLGGARLHDDRGVNHLIYQFDSVPHLHAWERSPRRRELLDEGSPFSDEHRATASGLDGWFSVPGNTAGQRWKTFLLTWAAAYPILLGLSLGLRTVLPGLPQPVLLLLSSGTLTAVLTLVIMPALTRRTRPWLLRGARPEPAATHPPAGD